jgi:DNA modification methylase
MEFPRPETTSEVNIYNEDCINGMADRIPDDSVHCLITSIPFGALFSYSHKRADIGNNIDGTDLHAGQFGLHMRFFLNQAYRILAPGSIACIHIQQLLRWKVQHGYMGMRDLRGALILMAENHGFQPHGEVAIVKNPQAVAQRLKLHSLMFVTGKLRDSRALAPAMNDYVMFFRKPGGDDLAIQGLYDAVDNPNGWFTQNEWIRWAHGCWTDILEIDVLEGYKCARDSDEEKHVCPLQLEVIRRCMKMYTAPGQVVIDPFMGIGSTAWVAIEQGRHCVGFELKGSYHEMAERNVARAKQLFEEERVNSDKQMTLFG